MARKFVPKTATEPAPGETGANEIATTGSPVVLGKSVPAVGQLLRASAAAAADWSDPGGEVAKILGVEFWTLGGTPPTASSVGTTPSVPALRFDAVAEVVAGTVVMPPDWDGSDVILELVFALTTAQTNGDQADFTLDYTASQELSTGNGPGKTSTQLTNTVTVTTGNGLASGDLYRASFTLSATDATNPLGSAKSIHLEFHLTNVTGVAAIDFIGGVIRFHSDVQGSIDAAAEGISAYSTDDITWNSATWVGVHTVLTTITHRYEKGVSRSNSDFTFEKAGVYAINARAVMRLSASNTGFWGMRLRDTVGSVTKASGSTFCAAANSFGVNGLFEVSAGQTLRLEFVRNGVAASGSTATLDSEALPSLDVDIFRIGPSVSPALTDEAIFPDLPPFSPSSLDDEFDGPSLDGKWSTWDPGSAHVFSVVTASKQLNVQHTGNNSVAWGGIYQAVPSSQFTAYAKLAAHGFDSSAVFGLIVAQDLSGSPTTADFTAIGMLNSAGARSSSHSAWNAAPTGTTSIPGGAAIYPLYVRARVNGTSVSNDISYDGIMWYPVQTYTLASITHVGLAGEVFANTIVQNWRVKFFRVIDGVSGFDDSSIARALAA